MNFYRDIHSKRFCDMLMVFIQVLNKEFPKELIEILIGMYKLEACVSWFDNRLGKKTVAMESKHAFMLDTTEMITGDHPNSEIIEVELYRIETFHNLICNLDTVQELNMKDYVRVRNVIVDVLPGFVFGINEYARCAYQTLLKKEQAQLAK